jgi:hypothetical protein
MQFLFVGSQVCTRASSRRLVALPPLPSASTDSNSKGNRIADENQRAFRKLSSIILNLSKYLFKFKFYAFHEEQEWRLLTTLKSDELISCKYRPSERVLLPYYELELKHTGTNPIHQIFLGPKNETPRELVHAFLYDNKHIDLEVKNSDATYR